jgi:thiol-disulfide isomerase/thioredoxin
MLSDWVHFPLVRTTKVRALGGLLGCLLALAANSAMAGQPLPKVGDLPPPTLGKTAAGDKVTLSDYQGKVVIVSFWATWCEPCRKEMPILASIQKQATRDKLLVFAVNWKDDRNNFRTVVKRLKEAGVDLEILSDEYGSYGKQYGVKAIPHMVIIGRDGRIARIHVGYGEGEIPVLVNEINQLLMAPTAPEPQTAAVTP